jgi:hypothetical protein
MLDQRVHRELAGELELEPGTIGSKGRCSALELLPIGRMLSSMAFYVGQHNASEGLESAGIGQRVASVCDLPEPRQILGMRGEAPTHSADTHPEMIRS